METKRQSDGLLERINEANAMHVPEKFVIREGVNVGLENPRYVVGFLLCQLFDSVRSRTVRAIQPSEGEGIEDTEQKRFVALSKQLREKMGQIIDGQIPDEIREVCNIGDAPLQSIEWAIGDTTKNVGDFVSLVMKEVFQDSAA